jgi:hypothetical protein
MVFSGKCQQVPCPRRIKNAFEPEAAFSWYPDCYQVGIPGSGLLSSEMLLSITCKIYGTLDGAFVR